MKPVLFLDRLFFVIVFLAVSSCTLETQSVSTVPPIQTFIPPSSTASVQFAAIKTPAPSVVPSSLPSPTLMPAWIGTFVPNNAETINKDNFGRLAKVAEWGKGSIQGVAFAPDGKSFCVGTAFGLAVYDMGDLTVAPQWIPFDAPFYYESLYFDESGRYVLLAGQRGDQVREFSNGKTTDVTDLTWIRPKGKYDYSNIAVSSRDSSKTFISQMVFEYNEALFTDEAVIRKVIDDRGGTLYELQDDVPYVTYNDRNEPEGCDLGVFSMCGNALMAIVLAPKKAEFSPDGKTLTILYFTPSLSPSNRFNILRVYNAENGSFVMSDGGKENPILDFAYSPDSNNLLVGYYDGTVQLLNIEEKAEIFGARHTTSPIFQIAFTNDSKYLLVQRADELEVRRTSDGSLISSYESVAFDLSPTDNIVAIAGKDHTIRVRRVEDGEKITSIVGAHEDLIYTVTFSPDGRYLASAGRDCNIKLWDVQDGKFIHYFEETKLDPYEINRVSRVFMYAMIFIPDTNLLLGFGSWGTVVVWNVNSGATLYHIQAEPLDYYNGMITLQPHFPDLILVDKVNQRFYLNSIGYDIETGKEVGRLPEGQKPPEDCAENGVKTKDGKLTFNRGHKSLEGKICVLDAGTMELVGTLDVLPGGSGNYYIGWPFLSPDEKQLIVTTDSGLIYVYQVLP